MNLRSFRKSNVNSSLWVTGSYEGGARLFSHLSSSLIARNPFPRPHSGLHYMVVLCQTSILDPISTFGIRLCGKLLFSVASSCTISFWEQQAIRRTFKMAFCNGTKISAPLAVTFNEVLNALLFLVPPSTNELSTFTRLSGWCLHSLLSSLCVLLWLLFPGWGIMVRVKEGGLIKLSATDPEKVNGRSTWNIQKSNYSSIVSEFFFGHGSLHFRSYQLRSKGSLSTEDGYYYTLVEWSFKRYRNWTLKDRGRVLQT